MSTRQNAMRYAHGGGGGGMGNLDLFGMHQRRRTKEAQAMSDIDLKADKDFEEVKAKIAKEDAELKHKQLMELKKHEAIINSLKDKGITPFDEKGNWTPELHRMVYGIDPRVTDNISTGVENKGLELNADNELFKSKRGQDILRTGTEARVLRPAIDAAAAGKRSVGPMETAQFLDHKDLFTGDVTPAFGASPKTEEFENKYNPKTGQLQTMPVRASGATPGGIGPSPSQVQAALAKAKQNAANNLSASPYNTSGGTGMGNSAPQIQTMPTGRQPREDDLLPVLRKILGLTGNDYTIPEGTMY
jgi:hypothetical protein